MVAIKKSYEIDGIRVNLVRDERGAHWECERCKGRCEHIIKAAAWTTLLAMEDEAEEAATRH